MLALCSGFTGGGPVGAVGGGARCLADPWRRGRTVAGVQVRRAVVGYLQRQRLEPRCGGQGERPRAGDIGAAASGRFDFAKAKTLEAIQRCFQPRGWLDGWPLFNVIISPLRTRSNDYRVGHPRRGLNNCRSAPLSFAT